MSTGTDVQVETVDLRGTEIAYRRKGSGDTVLFLHGLGFSRHWWPLYEQLAAHFDVVVPDLPGFGDSPQATWMRDWDDLSLLLAEFSDSIGIGKVHLIGHSFGGWAAAEFASFYPERVASLTLIAPLGARVEGDPSTDLFRRSADSRAELMVGDRVQEFFPSPSEEERLDRLTRDYLDLTGFGRLAWNPRYDLRLERRLGRVTTPVLIIGAKGDRVLPASHIDKYASLLPQARTVTIGPKEGTHHGVVVLAPDELAAEITTFIGEK